MKNRSKLAILTYLACYIIKSAYANDVVIHNVNTIDAVHGLQKNQCVEIHNNTISNVTSINTNLKHTHALHANIINGTNKFLIPGLWDFHVHLTFEPALEKSMFPLFIANGITSVRDTGGVLEKVLSWKKKSKMMLAPNVYIAGPLIDGKNAVYNGHSASFPKISKAISSKKEMKETVNQLVNAGVDLLKAYEMLTPELFHTLIVEARKHNKPVTGHVPLSMTAIQASNAGLRSMEHLRNFEMACSKDQKKLLNERILLLENSEDILGSSLRSTIHGKQHFKAYESFNNTTCDELINTLAKNNTWQIPTLTLMAASKYPYFIENSWAETFTYLPKKIKNKWINTTQKYKTMMNKPSAAREQRSMLSQWRIDMIKHLNKGGVKILAGTDTPIFFLTPGYSLHKELASLVFAGLTPLQALTSATLLPAQYFNLADKQGTIKQGMLADLVLLNANPLLNIENTTQINTVIKSGKVLNRTQLNDILQSVAAN